MRRPVVSSAISKAAVIAAAAFEQQEWTWADADAPSTADITQMLVYLVDRVQLSESTGRTATGRLMIEQDADGDIHLFLDLGTIWADGGSDDEAP